MKTNFINEDWDETYEIRKPGQSWLFENDHTFTSDSAAAISFGSYDNVQIILEGHAISNAASGAFGVIDGSGDDAMIIVTEIGSAGGRYAGIALHGDDAEIDNRGSVTGNIYGVYATGDHFYIDNKGYIAGNSAGLYMSGDQSAATNSDGGEIRGGVAMASADGETMWFNNFGEVTVRGTNAVSGGAGNDIIYNTGYLGGFVSLGAGDDILDTRDGQLAISRVTGGAGDDILVTGNAEYKLNEIDGQGYDTVKSTVSYVLSDNVEQLVLLDGASIDGTGNAGDNVLWGNRSANNLFGLDGDDVLNGGRGNDVLTGGEGMDTFVFATRFGIDTIADFTHGEDEIDLSGWNAVGSFKALMKRAEDHGDDLWIVAGKDVLVIEDNHKADMHKGDFDF